MPDVLRIKKTYYPELKRLFQTGELTEEELREMVFNARTVELELDELLAGRKTLGDGNVLRPGEGELTEEDCDRIGTELPPGYYRYIRVTTDEKKPKTIATIYLRTVDGELDEMWLASARKGMPPNPVDVVPGMPSFIPSAIGGPPRLGGGGLRRQPPVKTLPDAKGSQGVKGLRPTLGVEVTGSEDYDHRWSFANQKHGKKFGQTIRSSRLAPALLCLRENKEVVVSLSLVNATMGMLAAAR